MNNTSTSGIIAALKGEFEVEFAEMTPFACLFAAFVVIAAITQGTVGNIIATVGVIGFLGTYAIPAINKIARNLRGE